MFHIKSQQQYLEEYQKSNLNSSEFWSAIAKNFSWFKEWSKTSDCDLSQAKISWFIDGETNIAYNCLDRHIENGLANHTAIIWEGNDPETKTIKITYQELYDQTCQFANLLLANGIKKGDRVCIYMPMIVQSIVAMLACARIGAIHSVVFAGFSAKALLGRIQDCEAKILITSDVLFRADKEISLFEIAKEAIEESPSIESIIVFKRDKQSQLKEIKNKKLLIWQEEISKFSAQHQAIKQQANEPLFILYTSGSTGKPKGIVHSTGGYMVYAGYSFKNIFQYQSGDIFFCSADIGWITGHSYLVYGPLLNGATLLMFEGVPTYPTASRFWQVIEKHKVNIFYTAPTAIRALMQKGDEFAQGYDLSSLKTLGTVGEPINEEAWHWFNEKIGNKKCPIVDTWWQTETGGIMISTMSGIFNSRPSYAGLPMPGIVATLFDDNGKEIVTANKVGNLCLSNPWPSMALGIWGDKEKFFKTYYQQFPHHYFTGDGAFKDENGLYRIIGRTDDVIKVSGHRLGTAEIENAINSHPAISESAVIGVPHEIKGEAIYAFAIMRNSAGNKSEISKEIITIIQKEIGAIAKPEKIFLVSDLPKTRSGKIMRRVLKKIVAQESDLGDVSTLVNPEIVKDIELLLTANL